MPVPSRDLPLGTRMPWFRVTDLDGRVWTTADDHRDPAGETERVEDQRVALERGHQQIHECARGAEDEVRLPRLQPRPEHHATPPSRMAVALWSSPRSASSRRTSIRRSTSASVLAAVSCTRKPTSALGTSG